MTTLPISAFSEYDFMILVDRSGSMGAPTLRFASRWLEAKELTTGIASFAAQVDDDGITVISFGGAFRAERDVVDGVQADNVSRLFDSQFPAGSTPLHLAIAAALTKHFSSPKKSLIIIVTDGEPDDQRAVAKAIVDATLRIDDASKIRMLFIQVGDDPMAARWLDQIDSHLNGAKYDIVNTIGYVDANGLSIPELMTRAIEDAH